MSTRRFTTPPSLDELAALARAALDGLPAPLAAQTGAISLQVREFPDTETLDEMDLESAFDLLGLYVGTPLDEQSVGDSRDHVDVIQIYRRPILDYWCDSGEDLGHLVRHVVIHEIGHHFGFSDADMARLEEEAGTD
ncbi:MAG: acetylglutamate kinase [Alphaproteobacteria bacterium]|nr:acetylglutamate kinase [Alphaproteobacteria bacterium]